MALNPQKAQNYLFLYDLRKKLSAELKSVEEQEDAAEQELIAELLNNGLDAIKFSGRSLSISKNWHASMNNVEGIEAVLEAGMTELLSIQHKRLGAIVKEHILGFMEQNPMGSIEQAMAKFYEAHPSLTNLINVHEQIKLSTRKAG